MSVNFFKLIDKYNEVNNPCDHLEIMKYIHQSYEINMFRHVKGGFINNKMASQCAFNLWGITLDDNNAKLFINSHRDVIINYFYQKYANKILELFDNFNNNILTSDKYVPISLTKATFESLNVFFLNPTKSREVFDNIINNMSKPSLPNQKLQPDMHLNDLNVLELALIHLHGFYNVTFTTENNITMGQKYFPILKAYKEYFDNFLNIYQHGNKNASISDFERLNIASVVLGILYKLFTPRSMEIQPLHDLYDKYIKPAPGYKYATKIYKDLLDDHPEIIVPGMTSVGYLDKLFITKALLLNS